MIVLTISPQCVLCMSRASALVSMLRHSGAPTAAYPTMAAVEALAAVVCEPGARTTDPILRHALLSETGALGRPLFALFNHPASMPFGPPASLDFSKVPCNVWSSQAFMSSYVSMALNLQGLVCKTALTEIDLDMACKV